MDHQARQQAAKSIESWRRRTPGSKRPILAHREQNLSSFTSRCSWAKSYSCHLTLGSCSSYSPSHSRNHICWTTWAGIERGSRDAQTWASQFQRLRHSTRLGPFKTLLFHWRLRLSHLTIVGGFVLLTESWQGLMDWTLKDSACFKSFELRRSFWVWNWSSASRSVWGRAICCRSGTTAAGIVRISFRLDSRE